MGDTYRTEPFEGGERIHLSRTLAGRPMRWVSVYRVGDVLIDTGCPAAERAFGDALLRKPPRVVLCTHEHEDHVGNLHCAMAAGAEAYAPESAVKLLEAPGRLPPYRWLTWGPHPAMRGVKPLGADVRFEDRRFRVVPTPGHSPGHVSFLDRDTGVMFTGDAYLGKLKAMRRKEDIHAQVRSLRRILDLEPDVVAPAHGRIVRKPFSEMEATLEYFDALKRKARALASRGRTPREIRRDLLGPEPFLTWFSTGAFSAQNLVEGLLAPEDSGPLRT